MKPFAWSYSSLDLFELCPKKFYHSKIAKDYKDVFGHEAEYGKEVHKAFELRLIKGKTLPLDLTHHEKVMRKLADAKGEGFPEQKLSLNADMQPTGFFDDDVWLRGIIDYMKIHGTTAVILDHKTGRMKEGFDQVRLMAAIMSCYKPEIENFIVGYYWTKTKTLTVDRFPRDEVPNIWNNFLPRVEELQASIRHDEFPAKQNFLCKRHCPVKGCAHNGW